MDNLDALVIAYSGKFLDYDKAYGPQCVDLIEEYVVGVLHQNPIPGNAKDLFDNAPLSSYDKIGNLPTNFPYRGDIIITNGTINNPFGHCAIVLAASVMKVVTFSQNSPIGEPCNFEITNYNFCRGWLHPKNAQLKQTNLYIPANDNQSLAYLRTIQQQFAALIDKL